MEIPGWNFFLSKLKERVQIPPWRQSKKKSQTAIYAQVFTAMNSLNKSLKSFVFVSRLPDLPRVMLRMLMKFIHCFMLKVFFGRIQTTSDNWMYNWLAFVTQWFLQVEPGLKKWMILKVQIVFLHSNV